MKSAIEDSTPEALAQKYLTAWAEGRRTDAHLIYSGAATDLKSEPFAVFTQSLHRAGVVTARAELALEAQGAAARDRLEWIRKNLQAVEANGHTWYAPDHPELILLEMRPKHRGHWERVYGLAFNQDGTVAIRTCNYMSWSTPLDRIRVSEDAR
jgi:hypothetical protein